MEGLVALCSGRKNKGNYNGNDCKKDGNNKKEGNWGKLFYAIHG